MHWYNQQLFPSQTGVGISPCFAHTQRVCVWADSTSVITVTYIFQTLSSNKS